MLNKILDALLPTLCVLCDQSLDAIGSSRPTTQLCDHCYVTLPWNHPCCPHCALPLEPGAACAICPQSPPAFARAIAPLQFQSVVQTWLHALKFHQATVEGRVLGELLAAGVSDAYSGDRLPDAVTPVPLSRRRLAWRGHNQALTLASTVANRLGLSLRRTALRRIRHTPPQSLRTRSQRQHNVANVFISKPWSGQRVAIIDDVMTTGATATQMANAILQAGAAEVHVWVAARTPPPC